MKSPFLSCAMLLSLGALSAVYADSATWNLNPSSNDWNTAANWTPMTVPNGPTDVATFQVSNITNISVNCLVEVDRVVFDPGASAYSLTVERLQWLILLGEGIVNLSGEIQQFDVLNAAQLRFMNNASAGTRTLFYNRPLNGNTQVNYTQFFDNSSASGGTFINEGSQREGVLGASTQFHSESDAGDAVFINLPGINQGAGGDVSFWDSSNAANSTFRNHASPAGFAPATLFFNTSSASHGRFFNEGASQEGGEGGATIFLGTSTAAEAVLTCEAGAVSGAPGGLVEFEESSTAAEATLIASEGPGDGGEILFLDTTDGGTARVEVFGNSSLDLTSHDPPGLTIGSLEGDGLAFLGANLLSVGSNDLSTTFSGVIEGTGAVIKLGTSTLTLSGANTYSGGTTVTSGILFVSNISGSGTGTGAVSVNAGTLGGSGIIGGAVTVGTNSGAGAFLAPGADSRKTNTLTIQGALTVKADGTYSYRVKTKRNEADQVIANGVTIESGAQFSFRQLANKKLTVGTVFTVLDNISPDPITGTFANLPDDSTFTVGSNTYQADYQGGDGNDLTLTVVP